MSAPIKLLVVDDEPAIRRLLALRWWDWPAEKIFQNLEALTSGDLHKLLSL